MDDERIDLMDDKEHRNNFTKHSVVLQMVVDEIRQIRAAQMEQSAETREEFRSIKEETRAELRRLNDKLDSFRSEVHDSIGGHDRDIVRLTTQASMAGRVSGFFAGSIAGVITAILIDMARHSFFGG